MILPIYVYGTEVLRHETHEIDPQKEEGLAKLIDDMFETMYKADGVGLAAPQIGKSIRLFVIDADDLKAHYPETAGFKKAFINPSILEASDETATMEEGCLSLPGISESVTRPVRVRVRYMDLSGEWHEEWLEGFNARVFQHEYDHLEEVLFTDRVAPLRKQLIKGKLSKLSKGKVGAGYRTITGR